MLVSKSAFCEKMKRISIFSANLLSSLAIAPIVVLVLFAVPAVGATAVLGEQAGPNAAVSNPAVSNPAVSNSAVSNPAVPSSAQYSVQGTVASAQGAPVSYASVSQLNGLLTQLETTSKAAQSDLTNLRIERWKTDAAAKRQALGNVDSIERNLQNALPEIIAKLRATPEDVPATFRLYRNLDALYDVLGGVVEETGAFGSKDDLQALSNDLKAFEGTRKGLAERLENLATAKEAEIVRLRSDLKTARAAIPAPPPKITVVDDNEPPKKPAVKKKPATKQPGITLAPKQPATKPPAGQTQTPATQPPPAAKPQ
jgi:hypothetical protein